MNEIVFRKIVISILSLSIIGIGFNMWQSIIAVPFIGAASLAITFISLLIAAISFSVSRDRQLTWLEGASLLLTIISMIGWTTTNLYFHPAYGTDEVAFEQYAAQLFAHGINPYGVDLSKALELFQVPIQYATMTMNGHISSILAYPDLSFLFIVPFLKFGIVAEAALYNNILFFVVSTVLGFVLLPKPYKLVSPIVFVGLPVLIGFVLSGTNDIVLMPFLMLAAYRWTRYSGKGAWGWLSPIAYGIACSVQQLPWFIGPFLLTGIFLEQRLLGQSVNNSARVSIRYAVIAIGSFVIINLPFIIWDPTTWLSGIFTPILQHAIPYGQGLIDVSAFFGIGGGNVKMYTDGALLLIVAVLAVYIPFYRSMRYVAFFIPAFVLFFPARSLAEYFSNLFMVGFVAAFTIDKVEAGPRKNAGWKRWVSVAAFVPSFICFSLAFLSPGPLRIEVTNFQTDGQLRGVQQVNAVVINESDRVLQPHFALNYTGQMTTFWVVDKGPKALQPHQRAEYQLSAPNMGSMPPVNSSFQLQAVTPTPETINISKTYLLEKMHTRITPSHYNQVVHSDQTITMRVELRDHYGNRIKKSGVPISLSQIIYGQNGLIPAESTINKGNVGETPIVAYTNASGVAVFHVKNTSTQNFPIYYEAWISSPGKYPYGYSEIVVVNWVK